MYALVGRDKVGCRQAENQDFDEVDRWERPKIAGSTEWE
jgi:hypothetical protein